MGAVRRSEGDAVTTYGDITGRVCAHIVGSAFANMKKESDPMPITIQFNIREIKNGFVVSDGVYESYVGQSEMFFDSRTALTEALPGLVDAAITRMHEEQAKAAEEYRAEKAEYSEASNQKQGQPDIYPAHSRGFTIGEGFTDEPTLAKLPEEVAAEASEGNTFNQDED